MPLCMVVIILCMVVIPLCMMPYSIMHGGNSIMHGGNAIMHGGNSIMYDAIFHIVFDSCHIAWWYIHFAWLYSTLNIPILACNMHRAIFQITLCHSDIWLYFSFFTWLLFHPEFLFAQMSNRICHHARWNHGWNLAKLWFCRWSLGGVATSAIAKITDPLCGVLVRGYVFDSLVYKAAESFHPHFIAILEKYA